MIGLWLLALLSADGSLRVQWDAPSGRCSSTAEVTEQVRERLGDRLQEVERVELVGSVSEHEQGLQLRLRLAVDDVITERELQAPVCEELLRATMLIVSLAVAPPPTEDAPPAEDAPPTDDTPPAEPSTPSPVQQPVAAAVAPSEDSPTEPDEPRDSPTFVGIDLRAGAGVAAGRRPGASAVVTAGGRVHGRRWLAAVDLTYGPPRDVFVSGFDDRGATIQSWIVALDGGVRWPITPRLSAPTTLGLELGALVARGFGVDAIARGAQPWVAPAVSAGLDVRLTRWLSLWAAGRASVALVQPAFAIEGRGTLFRSEFGSVSAAAGLMFTVR